MFVIADDITGAAEMAGIAHHHGLPVRLVCGWVTATSGTTVIATDTRSMTEEEAVAETRRILSSLPHQGGDGRRSLFKKTDSALRGHVVAELSTLMEATGYQRAVYLPANPSKGRIIRAGTYYINNTPIHETAFSYDPEFPATTSVLQERFPDAAQKGILMPDAETTEDIRKVIADYDDGHTLFAGAADLFEAWLTGDSSATLNAATLNTELLTQNFPSTLLLCGSTQSKPLDLGIPVTEMPRAIYDGSKDITSWLEEARARYEQATSLMITIPFHHRTGKEVAVHLREMTATLIQQLVALRLPQQLIIEGGASAFATLRHLGWNELEMVCQIAPGVIKTKAPNGTFVIMKPGSYPWGSLF
ncbi:MAG: four-carbon acid sugar kinase family protein [Prevotella sp.]|nr:four-carbon acid sugar kinase family protein [Prevotella sp.]